MRRWQRRIEAACRAVFPQRTIYVVSASSVPERYRPRGTFGITGRGLDLIFRQEIGERWVGRGAVILLNPSEAVSYAKLLIGNPAINARRILWRTAAHEASHIADRPILPSEEKDEDLQPKADDISSALLAEFCAVESPLAVLEPVAWHDHDARFFRLLFHVAHRIMPFVDVHLCRYDWADTLQYALPSSDYKYRAALGDEPERLADVPLTEISSIPPPTAFTNVWANDLRYWFGSIENPTDYQTAALVRGLNLYSLHERPVLRKVSVMDCLGSVLEKVAKRKADALASYRALVGFICDGRELDADHVVDVLAASGKTPEDLRAAVGLLTERRRLRQQLDTKPAAEKRIVEIVSALQAIERKREAFDKKCDDERWPLDCERETLQATIAAAGNAQRELYATCGNAEILDRSKEITKDAENISVEIRRLTNEREWFLEMAVDAHKAATSTTESDGARVFSNKDSEQYRGYCVNLDGQIARLQADRAKLLAEQSELDTRRLEP